MIKAIFIQQITCKSLLSCNTPCIPPSLLNLNWDISSSVALSLSNTYNIIKKIAYNMKVDYLSTCLCTVVDVSSLTVSWVSTNEAREAFTSSICSTVTITTVSKKCSTFDFQFPGNQCWCQKYRGGGESIRYRALSEARSRKPSWHLLFQVAC